MHLKGKITNGENFGLSTGLLVFHIFQIQRLHELSMGAAFKSPEGNGTEVVPLEIYEFLWALERGFVLILSSSFHNSLCCENQPFQDDAIAVAVPEPRAVSIMPENC